MLSMDLLKESIYPFIEEYGIEKAGVFGSYARNDVSENSDIDLLFSFNKRFGLIKLIHLKQALEDKLGKPVDIVEFNTRNKEFIDNIMEDVIIFYDREG